MKKIQTNPLAMTRCFSLLIFCFVMALLASLPVQAQRSDLSGFSFLRLEPSARAAALGGSFSAVYGNDVNAFFYNPALLNETMDGSLSLSYLNHVSDLNAGVGVYSRHLEGKGTVVGSFRFLSWGSFEEADELGNRTGTFSASDLALTLGAARAYSERLRYGISTHLVYSSVSTYHAAAVAVDGGVAYQIPEQQLTLSASVHHLGVTLTSLGSIQDKLPLDVRLSVSKRLRYFPLLLSLTTYDLQNIGQEPEGYTTLRRVLDHTLLGAEFQISQSFHLRAGYDYRLHKALKGSSRLDSAGLGLGFGLKVNRFNLDYAYSSWSFAGLHQLTLRTTL